MQKPLASFVTFYKFYARQYSPYLRTLYDHSVTESVIHGNEQNPEANIWSGSPL